MSKSSSAIVMVPASKAWKVGYRSLLESGEVRKFVFDGGQEMVVRAVHDVTSKLVIIKDGRNKRRKVPRLSIKTLGVTQSLARLIPA